MSDLLAPDDKIRCDACPVMCIIKLGATGACDRYANHAGALARLDPQVDPGHGRQPTPGVAPSPALDEDAGRSRHQTSRRSSRPAAKRLSAPVAASARTSSQPTSPARIAPDTSSEPR